MKRSPLPFLIILSVASIFWLPNLFAKGMFMDGVYDALFAHNLVNGIGGFWAPQTADYAHPSYWDNPQLSSYFLSLWYKVFGDFYWVERLYSLTCALIQLALIASAWKIYFSEKALVKDHSWLPCLLFLVMPLTSWCYSNNMMENTMSIFTTGSVLVFLLFLRTGKSLFLYSVIGGALIFLGLLTKGPVALFPFAAPFFFIWIEKDLSWKKAFIYMILQFTVAAVLFAIVFSREAPKTFLHNYLDVQLMKAIKHEMKANAPSYYIFIQLLLTTLPLIILSGLSFFVSTGKSSAAKKSLLQTALVFTLIGLSASAPIALSAKQNKHYLLPSLPLFAIGFACFIIPLVKWVEEKITDSVSEKAMKVAAGICVLIIGGCIALSVKNVGSYCRDEVLLRDIGAVQALVKSEPVIRADWSLYDNWALRANLNRLYNKKICMPDEVAETGFYLTKSNGQGDRLPANAPKIYSGKMYDLYRISP